MPTWWAKSSCEDQPDSKRSSRNRRPKAVRWVAVLIEQQQRYADDQSTDYESHSQVRDTCERGNNPKMPKSSTVAGPAALLAVTLLLAGCGSGSDLKAGGESRYNSTYVARVTDVKFSNKTITLTFDAQGDFDLRRPETSCIKVTGADGKKTTVQPTKVDLTANAPGTYKGSMLFPAEVPGSYGFIWSCSSDYSVAELGTVK